MPRTECATKFTSTRSKNLDPPDHPAWNPSLGKRHFNDSTEGVVSEGDREVVVGQLTAGMRDEAFDLLGNVAGFVGRFFEWSQNRHGDVRV